MAMKKAKTVKGKSLGARASAVTKKVVKKLQQVAKPKAGANATPNPNPRKPAKVSAEAATLAKRKPKTKVGKSKAEERSEDVASESRAAEASVGIQVGDHAPSFVLHDDTGVLVSSESLRGSPYVLYFYPKDDTPGCTLQACGFRDAMPRFEAKGVRVLGVSPDDPEAHARFKKKYGLEFTLLSDPEKTLAKAYGVWVMKKNYGREYMGVERSTFYVDRRGTVQRVWRSVRVPGHVDTVIHSV